MAKSRLLTIYILNQTGHWFLVGLLVPVLTLLQLDKGLSLFQVGITGALYSGTILLLELPTGGLADALGRKRVYLSSLVATFLGVVTVALGRGFWQVAAGVSLWGVGRALSSGTIDAWFVDEFHRLAPEDNLQQATARANIFIPLGLCLGSLIGGVLPMACQPMLAKIPRLGIYAANPLLNAVLLIAQFILTVVLVREPSRAAGRTGVTAGLKMFPRILATAVHYGLRNRVVFLLLLTTLAWGFGFAGLETFWQPRVKTIRGTGAQTWIFGLLSAGYFLAGSLGSLIITPLCRLFHNRYELVLFLVRAIMGGLFLILALQAGIVGFSLFYLALFLANGMGNSPHAAIFHREVPGETRATLLSLDSLCLSVGGLSGSLLLGFLAGAYSIPISWYVAAGVIGTSGLLYLLVLQHGRDVRVMNESRGLGE